MRAFRNLFLAATLGGALLALGCERASDSGESLEARRYGEWGVDLSGMDTGVHPGDDFFRHAVGRAYEGLEIPADRRSWGVAEQLAELSDARLIRIIEQSATAFMPRGETAKVGALYNSFMDEARLEELGARALEPDLAEVRAANTHEKQARLMGTGQSGFYNLLFAPFVGIDQKDPDRYTVYVNLGGLGLPDREYYLDPRYAEAKAGYRAYVEQMLALAGWPEPARRADEILAFETEVARVHWPIAERRDDVKMYNARTIAELKAEAPAFPWDAFLEGAELKDQERLVIGEASAFPAAAQIFARTPVETLQAWQAFNLADQSAPYLSKAFVDARFNFRLKQLNGVQQLRSRDKRGVQAVNTALGEAVGRLYVNEYFPAESKAKMEELVANLKAAFRVRLQNATWMTDATKAEALRKLDAITVKIGYPNRWRDYSGLQIRNGDLWGNMRRALAFDWDYQRNKLGQPIDRDEWFMTPQTVNAYYNSTLNEIVFPAAFLQPPFFDPQADDAVNYGSIGAVIGHEITHGFDDQGRKSDAVGMLRDWWRPEDAARYDAQAQVLGAQFALFEPVPGHRINAALTMGENIADLGGVLIAYDAYRASLGGRAAPVLDGLTGDQRFFLSYAQSWLGKRREQAVIELLASDPHSPDRYRVLGTLPNVDAFYAAFNVQPTNAMYIPPERRARVW